MCVNAVDRASKFSPHRLIGSATDALAQTGLLYLCCASLCEHGGSRLDERLSGKSVIDGWTARCCRMSGLTNIADSPNRTRAAISISRSSKIVERRTAARASGVTANRQRSPTATRTTGGITEASEVSNDAVWRSFVEVCPIRDEEVNGWPFSATKDHATRLRKTEGTICGEQREFFTSRVEGTSVVYDATTSLQVSNLASESEANLKLLCNRNTAVCSDESLCFNDTSHEATESSRIQDKTHLYQGLDSLSLRLIH